MKTFLRFLSALALSVGIAHAQMGRDISTQQAPLAASGQGLLSPSITTSIVTPSTSFSLLNSVATTINAFGAATTLNIGNAGGTNTILGTTTLSGVFNGQIGQITPGVIAGTTGTLTGLIVNTGAGLFGTVTDGGGAGTSYQVTINASGGGKSNALVLKSSIAGNETVTWWNTATSGNNIFATFYTEASPTQRGQISYLRASDALSITGGTGGVTFGSNSLTAGAISGTTGAFSGSINSIIGNSAYVLSSASATTGWQSIRFQNTSGDAFFGVEGSVAYLITGDTAYDTAVVGKTGIAFSANEGVGMQMRLASTGLSVTGHLQATGGTAPSIASGACGTGTNGSVAGTDQSGVITVGASATTACAVTFGTTMGAAPHCTFSPATAASAALTVLAYVSATGTGGFTISGSAMASTSFEYLCF